MNDAPAFTKAAAGGGRKRRLVAWLLSAVCAIAVMAGLQGYGFYRHFVPGIRAANTDLDRLMTESSSHDTANRMLKELSDLHDSLGKDPIATRVVDIYHQFIDTFADDPRRAINDFDRMLSGLSGQLPAESDKSARVRSELADLREVYDDHYGEIVKELQSPPLYLQPTAALLRNRGGFADKVRFNYAVYLSAVGDHSRSNKILNDLKDRIGDGRFKSEIYYAQARLLYGAFKKENGSQYFEQALEDARLSLRNDAGYGIPKLFLEYLLSLNSGATLNESNSQGQGTGKAQGKKGMISTNPPRF